MTDAEPGRLDAYVVGVEYDDAWNDMELVIARSHEEAVRLAHPDFDDERVAAILAGDDEFEVECQLNSTVWTGEPRVDRSVEAMRAAGLHFADERQCDSCEEWSEDVCQDCDLCPSCSAEDPDHTCDLCNCDDKEPTNA